MENSVPRSHFDRAYDEGAAPWVIDEPQPAIVRLAESGQITGRVLDAGCGTGCNALHLAGRGLTVTGFDVAAAAVETARARATERGLEATFLVADALRVDLPERYDSVLDCGLFHTFDDTERARYVGELAGVTRPGGRLALLCFSDAEPGDGGPRRITRQELADSFADGWRVVSIEPDLIETRVESGPARAWLARIEGR